MKTIRSGKYLWTFSHFCQKTLQVHLTLKRFPHLVPCKFLNKIRYVIRIIIIGRWFLLWSNHLIVHRTYKLKHWLSKRQPHFHPSPPPYWFPKILFPSRHLQHCTVLEKCKREATLHISQMQHSLLNLDKSLWQSSIATMIPYKFKIW